MELSGADGEPIALEVSGLPLDFDITRDRFVPMPKIPKRMVQNAKGAVLRDPDTREVVWEEDDSPSEARAALERARRDQQLLMVVVALRDSDVTFSSLDGFDLEAEGAPADFRSRCDALHAEITAAGFGAGHLLRIQKAAMEASGITPDLLESRRGSFT